jgi:glycine cleavage system H protein
LNVPAPLFYSQSHEWVEFHADGTATVGITDYAQDHLGEVVYAEPPAIGTQVKVGAQCAVVESTKAAADVYAPVTGEVIAVNGDLSSNPQTINEAPYAGGWLFKVKVANATDRAGLMDATAYQAHMAAAS